MKKAALHNLGCKVNAYETEAMQEMLEQAGYEIVPFKEGADVYIINTCTVTNIADRKSRQMLHRARKLNPDAVVVAAGCYVQAQEGKEIDPCIDIVIGNNHKKDLPELLKQYEMEKSGHTEYAMEDINRTKEYEELHLTKPGDHTRAYIKVQDGCNQFCTYCIIPYARGRVRSRQTKDVLEEVRDLAGNGYKEVVLTGIHLSSYGIDFDGQRHLLDLIKEVHKVEGIERIRLGSLEPGIITEEFAKELSEMPDVIVGFPGETEEEFEASYAFVDRVDFYETHIFKYSKREGTKAAVMDGQIDEKIKGERSARMIALGERKKKAYEDSFIGKEVEVLFEERAQIEGKAVMTGHTKEYMKIALETEKNISNCIVKVRIENHSQIIR